VNPFVIYSLGAVGFGLISDIIGRKWAFNITCLITSIFGMLMVSLQMPALQ
jgi:MFS family permease